MSASLLSETSGKARVWNGVKPPRLTDEVGRSALPLIAAEIASLRER